jgi:hypothetical protein
MDMSQHSVPPSADRLEDRAVKDVRADGRYRREVEAEHEYGRHERPAAHAGNAHQQPDAEPDESQLPNLNATAIGPE